MTVEMHIQAGPLVEKIKSLKSQIKEMEEMRGKCFVDKTKGIKAAGFALYGPTAVRIMEIAICSKNEELRASKNELSYIR